MIVPFSLLAAALVAAAPAPAANVRQVFVYNHNALVRTRIDPILATGKVSGHTHVFSGANRVTTDATFASLTAADCTTAPLSIDKSLYWAPQLYYKDDAGKYTAISGSGLVTYWLYHRGPGDPDKFPELPDDFRMTAGNIKRTTLDLEQAANKAVSFQCFKGAGGGSYGNEYDLKLPYIPADKDCETIRPQIVFPNCWDGKNAYKEGNAHVAYGANGDHDAGACPPGWKRIPQLLAETYYNPSQALGSKYKWKPGCLVFANGDNFGLSFHADWINGFPKGTLNTAYDQCKDKFDGTAASCPYLAKHIQTDQQRDCTVAGQIINEAVGLDAPLDRLPGNNPEFNSSALANKPKVVDPAYVEQAKVVKIGAGGGVCKTNKCTDFKTTS